MKKWSKTFVLIGTGLLSSCFSLGTYRLPDTPEPSYIASCANQNWPPGISGELRDLGGGLPLPTARSVWGTITRHVYPFGHHTRLLSLKIENQSPSLLWLDPAQVHILDQQGQQYPLIEKGVFEKAWPHSAVRNTDEMLDRSLVQAELKKALFERRPLLAGESIQVFLPFQTLVPQRLELGFLSHSFCW